MVCSDYSVVANMVYIGIFNNTEHALIRADLNYRVPVQSQIWCIVVQKYYIVLLTLYSSDFGFMVPFVVMCIF